MSRTDTRVSRKTFDTACANLWKERQKNAALLKAVEELLIDVERGSTITRGNKLYLKALDAFAKAKGQ